MKKQIVIILALVCTFWPAEAQESAYLFQPGGANFFVYSRGGGQFIINQANFTLFNINKRINQLASAKRIVTAADDPAGLAVAEKMDALIQGMRREVMNAEDLKNYYSVVESAIAQDNELLKRIRFLIQKSAGVLMGPEEREINQVEISQLLRQVDMNAQFTHFNTRKVIPFLTTSHLGIDKVSVVNNLYGSYALVEEALKHLRKLRTGYGALTNVLEFQIKGKTMYYINFTASESRMRDLNMAEGITNLINNSVILKTRYGILLKK